VLMLEAGRNYPAAEAPMFQAPEQAPLRAAGTPDKPFGFHDATVDFIDEWISAPHARQQQDRAVIRRKLPRNWPRSPHSLRAIAT